MSEYIQGLNQNCAIKVGEYFIVCLSNSSYQIDGKIVVPTYKTGYQICVGDIENIQRVIPSTRILAGFKSLEGEELSVESVHQARNEMEEYYDDSEDEYIFPNIDVEFEVRKRLEKYLKATPVYEEIPSTMEKVDIQLVGAAQDTGSPFITTPFVYGRMTFSGTGGYYKVFASAIASDELQNFAIRHKLTLDIPTHSHLEYVKTGGKYLFTGLKDPWVTSNSVTRVYNNLEDARQAEADIRSRVNKHLRMRTSELTLGDLSKTQVAEIYKKLQSALTEVRSLDVKVAGRHKHSGAIKSVGDILKTFETIVEGVEDGVH